jgi:hypothetical protein
VWQDTSAGQDARSGERANAAGGVLAAGNKAEDTAIKLQRATQIGLKRADAASAQWYRERAATLRHELRTINQGTQTPEQKAAHYKSLQDRARTLTTEFQNVKTQNRRALGLSDDGMAMPGLR